METGLYESEDKTQRRRVIIVTSIIAIVVLCIAAWAIVAIVGSSDKNIEPNTNKTEVATDDGAAAAAATAATEKTNTENKGTEKTDAEKTDAEKTETEAVVANKETDNKETANKEAANKETDTPQATSAEKNAEVSYFTRAADEVPETGPEELLPLALVVGAIVTFIGSRKLAKRRA